MQDTQTTKAKKFICRLKLIGKNKRFISPAYTSPPTLKGKTKEKPQPKKKALKLQIAELTRTQKRDYDFYRFQKRMDIKLKAIGLKIASPTEMQLQKPKSGIMDNIGEFFECSYDIPAKPKRFTNS